MLGRPSCNWLGGYPVVVVADSGFSAVNLLAAVRARATVVTRLRLDAALYGPVPPRTGKPGRPRKRGARQPTLTERIVDPSTVWARVVVSRWYGERERSVEVATGTALWYRRGVPGVWLRWVVVRDPSGAVEPKGFLCTDPAVEPATLLGWYLRRWSVEVTFAEVRRHLGVETQRQWSDLAVARTTPCLLGLFSVVALVADHLHTDGRLATRQSAWYEKTSPTFSDALAAVRVELWRAAVSETSGRMRPMSVNTGAVFDRMSAALAYAG